MRLGQGREDSKAFLKESPDVAGEVEKKPEPKTDGKPDARGLSEPSVVRGRDTHGPIKGRTVQA